MHAVLKLVELAEHAVEVDEETVRRVVLDPDKIEVGRSGRLIAQGFLDDEHVLRVVFEPGSDELVVITAYPGRRARYG
jgi:hypothetical protein